MGGYLAFECLRQWPQGIRAAALLDTTAYPDDPGRVQTREQVLNLLGWGGFSQVLGAFVPSVLAPGLALDHPARDLMVTMARDLGPAIFAADMRAILERGDFQDVLQHIRVPVLFAAGEEDSLTPPAVARRMAADVPGSRVVEIPAAGHMAPLENPQFTAQLLGEFFGGAFAI
jgi:pimeloyl-ACP methyl ester carboxylesterase